MRQLYKRRCGKTVQIALKYFVNTKFFDFR